MHNTLQKDLVIAKYDSRTSFASGCFTDSQVIDKDGEKPIYGPTKVAIRGWADKNLQRTRAAGQEPSMGACRTNHNAEKIAGKITDIEYDDTRQRINGTVDLYGEAKLLADEGMFWGSSIAGRYAARNCAECNGEMMGAANNYCPRCQKNVVVEFVPDPVEISVVDVLCCPTAVIEHVKADGETVLRKSGGSMSRNEVVRLVREHSAHAGVVHAKNHEALAECHKSLGKGFALIERGITSVPGGCTRPT